MNRRHAVKNLLFASGGLITLPAWMQACGISETETHQSSFSSDEQGMLAHVTDTIIPAGNSIGALSVGVDKYLQKLIDDCYEKPEQDNVKKQLKVLDASAKNAFKKSFSHCSRRQREAALMKMSASNIKEEKDFFELIKKETIRGFNTSQRVMEDYLDYKIAPGHYYGCVDIEI